MQFIPMLEKLYFQHHYCSLQCHMIFRNHNNMIFAAQETFLIIINVENTCVLFGDSLMNRNVKRTAFIRIESFCNILH